MYALCTHSITVAFSVMLICFQAYAMSDYVIIFKYNIFALNKHLIVKTRTTQYSKLSMQFNLSDEMQFDITVFISLLLLRGELHTSFCKLNNLR